MRLNFLKTGAPLAALIGLGLALPAISAPPEGSGPGNAAPGGSAPESTPAKKAPRIFDPTAKSSRKDPKAAEKKAAEPEKKAAPAAYQQGTIDDAAFDEAADKKRDEQIEQLKKILPKIQGPQKADLLFQLAERWWEKSKYVSQKGFKKFVAAQEECAARKERGETCTEPKIETFTREGELYRQEALRKYDEILKEYPTYPRKDEVLFAFAFNKYEVGQKEEAIIKYAELIRQYPASRFVPDAYIQMGEHYFNTNNLEFARTAYQNALETNSPRIKYFALYKLAWCDVNIGAYDKAVEKFHEVVASAAIDSKNAGLKIEALRDLIRCYTALDSTTQGIADEAITYYKKNTGKDNARSHIARLGASLKDAGRHESSIRVYRSLINDEPFDPRCPEYQTSIVGSYEGLRQRDRVGQEVRRLVELYRPGSDWAKANAANKAALAIAYEITEEHMRNLVVEYHQEAQRTKEVATYRLARDIYKEYLDAFADSEFAYSLRYYYAEILWALTEYEEAATQYFMAFTKEPDGQYSKLAAFNTVLCYEKLVDIEKGNIKMPELKDGKKIDDKAGKGDIKRQSTKTLGARGGSSEEEEIPKFEAKLVESIDAYVKRYPDTEDEINFRYKAAFVFYDHKHDVEAARRFAEIISRWPTDSASRKAADFSLDILNKKEEWFELNRLAREFAANKRLVGNDKEFGTRIEDLVEASQYMYVDKVVYNEQKDAPKAAVMFKEFVAEFPDSKYAAQALLYATVIHSEAIEYDLAIQTGDQLLRVYPNGETIAREPTKPRALSLLGFFSEKTAEFQAAADYYERFANYYLGGEEETVAPKGGKSVKAVKSVAKKSDTKGRAGSLDEKKSDEVANALYNAALWNEGLGNFDKAISLYGRYVETFPGRKDASEIVIAIGLVHEKQKNYKEAARVFKGFADRYGREVPVTKVLYAKYHEMLAYRDGKQEKELQAKAEEIIKYYEGLPEADRAVDQAANIYAHSRFIALEPMWRDYSNIRFNNVAKLKTDLKAKLEALPKAEQAYLGVIETKSPEWGVAALVRIGQLSQDFARNLVESPDPRGLDEDQLMMYRSELESRAFPLEDKALEAYERALQKSTELMVYNDWTLLAQDQINKLKPGSFLERRDVPFMGSESFATAPAITALPEAEKPAAPAVAPPAAAPAPVAPVPTEATQPTAAAN